MAQTIKLMADYQCWPLWWVDDARVGDIDPHDLPLTPRTIARLTTWAATFDATLNWQDPAASVWPSPAARAAFEQEGIALWVRLREELQPDYTVVYKSQQHRRTLLDPDELRHTHS